MGSEHDHVVITDRCILCRSEDYPPLAKGDIITITNMPPLDGTYKVKQNKKGTIELEFQSGKASNDN